MTFPLTGKVLASLRRLREAEANEELDQELNVQLCSSCGVFDFMYGRKLHVVELIAAQEGTFVKRVNFNKCYGCISGPTSSLLVVPERQQSFHAHYADDLRLYILAGHHKRA